MNRNYTCKETCGMDKHCGNKYCSAHPDYIPITPKKRRNKMNGAVAAAEGVYG